MRANRKQTKGPAIINQVASHIAFTLIELMVSMAVLGLIMVVLFSIFDQVNKAWLTSENRVETFTQARAILDIMSRELSQAITNPKILFHGEANAIYFVAPVNTDPGGLADLCEVGYVFNAAVPPHVTFTRRVTQSNNAAWDFYTNPSAWWTTFDTTKDTIIANDSILNVSFKYYDSTGTLIPTPFTNPKLPYSVQIEIQAVDSRASTRLKLIGGAGGIQNALTTTAGLSVVTNSARPFQTTVYFPGVSP